MVAKKKTECIYKDPDGEVLELVEYDGEGTEWDLYEHFDEWGEIEDWIYDKYPIDWFGVESLLVKSTHSAEDEILACYAVTEIVSERFRRKALNYGESAEFAEKVAQAAVDEYLHRRTKSWRYRQKPEPLYSEIVEMLRD